MLLAELIESALAQAQPGLVRPGQGDPEAWPGRQSGNCVHKAQVLESRKREATKSTEAKKFNKITVPIPAQLGLGHLRFSLA